MSNYSVITSVRIFTKTKNNALININVNFAANTCDTSTYQGGTMPRQLLDISKLPFESKYDCQDGTTIDMKKFLENLRTPINVLGTTGNIGQVDSLGFVMAKPLNFMVNVLPDDYYWDDPVSYVWFAGGWGPDRDMYIANAVRKMRAMLREGLETLYMRLGCYQDTHFRDLVDQTDAIGNFAWGDFPWGGAVEVQLVSNLLLHGAVSCFDDDVDDDITARLILGILGKQILISDGLKPID